MKQPQGETETLLANNLLGTRHRWSAFTTSGPPTSDPEGDGLLYGPTQYLGAAVGNAGPPGVAIYKNYNATSGLGGLAFDGVQPINYTQVYNVIIPFMLNSGANEDAWIGFSANPQTSAVTSPATAKEWALTYFPGRGDTNFMVRHHNGTIEARIDTGITPASFQWYMLVIEHFDQGGGVRGMRFSIRGIGGAAVTPFTTSVTGTDIAVYLGCLLQANTVTVGSLFLGQIQLGIIEGS